MKTTAGKKVLEFFAKYRPLYYKKGETILRAFDDPRGVNYIVRGYVKLYFLNQDGQEFTFNIFKPGSYFPIIWAMGGRDNYYYYEAMTPTEIRRAPKEAILKFIQEDPTILYELTKRLISGLEGLLIRMEHVLYGDANQKIKSTLYLLAKRFGTKNGGNRKYTRIDLPITHQGIASLVGLSRETTSLEMKKLEREGIIGRANRYILVKRVRKLKPRYSIYPRERLTPPSY
jgi:CRP/FNR family transcriptional regulator